MGWHGRPPGELTPLAGVGLEDLLHHGLAHLLLLPARPTQLKGKEIASRLGESRAGIAPVAGAQVVVPLGFGVIAASARRTGRRGAAGADRHSVLPSV